MIAIAAATGNIGRVLWPALAEAGKPVRLLVRNPLPAAEDHPGVETAVVDLDRPDTLVKALSGADRLFLLSPGPDTPAQDAAAIRAAHEAGLISGLGRDTSPLDSPPRILGAGPPPQLRTPQGALHEPDRILAAAGLRRAGTDA